LSSTVEEQLIDADTQSKESSRIRVIQRVDREVFRGESARQQQRAEDKDRLIASLP
jgi:hypothetical protein